MRLLVIGEAVDRQQYDQCAENAGEEAAVIVRGKQPDEHHDINEHKQQLTVQHHPILDKQTSDGFHSDMPPFCAGSPAAPFFSCREKLSMISSTVGRSVYRPGQLPSSARAHSASPPKLFSRRPISRT